VFAQNGHQNLRMPFINKDKSEVTSARPMAHELSPSQIMTNNKEHRPWRQTTQSNRTATSVETSVNNFNRKETEGREAHPILPFHWPPLSAQCF